MTNDNKPIREVYAKTHIGALTFQIICLVLILVLFNFVFFDSDNIDCSWSFIRNVTMACVTLLGCGKSLKDSLRAIVLRKRCVPLLRLYNDRIEYKGDIYNSEDDVYYFQDIVGIKDNVSDVIVTLSDGFKKEVQLGRLDSEDCDLKELVKSAYNSYKSQNKASSSVRFKSSVVQKDLFAKVIEVVYGVVMIVGSVGVLVFYFFEKTDFKNINLAEWLQSHTVVISLALSFILIDALLVFWALRKR